MGPLRILECLSLSDSLPRTSVMNNLTRGWWSICMHRSAFSSLDNQLRNWRHALMKFSFK